MAAFSWSMYRKKTSKIPSSQQRIKDNLNLFSGLLKFKNTS